ncbi:hypothetical protein GA0070624_0410 [Micromonospora rhizosphaerae]|uniref:Phosphotransferase enzyme family protein n=1 Tax=Micromonospora rhizosphaerae TaxID=568872 RepID=A0A1C6RBP7_9ACTN|nr:aminoglycoside phosphotransferase [Micromonospora rhizosphaerae]SCL14402.1 hypothetical protein GA0070624_0410 [Micromonospora rhizosphaerae]
MTPTLRADDVCAVASDIVGEPVRTGAWQVEEVAYESGSPATGGLYRVRGITASGQPWSVFVKLLQHVRHWPRLHLLPPDMRQSFADWFPWRQEMAAWHESFAGRLPAGMRLPVLYRVTDLGDDRLLLWMEDINALDGGWDLARFAQAAQALGGLAALRSAPEVVQGTGYPAGWGLRGYADGRVSLGALPLLADDDLWRNPLLADTVDSSLRADLRRLAGRLPAILDQLDNLPQAVPHGDASPQNLLVPADAPWELVAIDISFQCPLAIGFDLGQLLIGLVHSGQMASADLADVHDVLVESFAAGMKEYGVEASPEDVEYGYVGSLVVRAGFTSLPFELLDAPPSAKLVEMFHERAALTRFIADLGVSLSA